MSVITLEEQKRHMNVDFDDDDALITANIDAAESYITALIGESLADMASVPGALRQATRMLAAHFYENREAASFDGRAAELPFGFMDLVTPFRVWSF
jgi:uncharacterized phage protein (predicted DNA packaging)